jgi:uncharacterized protein (TIGR02145 family)
MTAATNTGSVNVTTPNGTNTANSLFTYRYGNSSFLGGNSYTVIQGSSIALGGVIQVGGTNCVGQKIMGNSITGNVLAACVTPTKTAGAQTVTIGTPTAAPGHLQGFATACTATIWTNTSNITVLTDTRDGKTYRVRCFSDGHWWMIDNLALVPNSTTLTTANTNFSGTQSSTFANTWSKITAPVQSTTTHNQGYCDFATPTAGTGTTGFLTCDSTQTRSATNSNFVAYSNPSQSNTYVGWICNNQIMINAGSRTNCGYLYNWYTATAGSMISGGAIVSSVNVTSSICPAGWKLPTGDGLAGGQFGILNNAMLSPTAATAITTASTTNSVTTRPNWRYNGLWQGSLSGYYLVGNFSNQGYQGYYWSSSQYSGDVSRASSLNFYYDTLYPGIINFFYEYGFAIRCVL